MEALLLDTLENLPSVKDEHIWADYVELLCLTSLDTTISKAGIVDRINERHDVGENSPVNDETDNIDHYDFNSLEETRTMPSAIDSRNEQFIEDVFSHLEYRDVNTLKGTYPFEFSPKRNSLSLRSSLSKEQKLYLFFLIASNIRCLTQSTKSKVPDLFEVISRDALKNYMPSPTQVYIFGTNTYDDAKRYKGVLVDKIKKLAEDLGDKPHFKPKDFKPTNTGDGGLDIVAWLPFKSGTTGNNIRLFGQCACTEEWVKKQHTSNTPTWAKRISFGINPINAIFIPFCYHSSNGGWFNEDNIHQGTILFDRIRLMSLLLNHVESIHESVFEIVDAALQQKSSYV